LHELGLLQLSSHARTAEGDVWNFFLQQRDVERCLDIIEIVFECMVRFVKADAYVNFDGMSVIGRAMEEVSARFQEHAVGYEFKEGRFIRIDSAFLHQAVVDPAMELLRESYLAGADQEFAKAHEHFRHRRFGECINECLKAFESTMKAICHERGWSYN